MKTKAKQAKREVPFDPVLFAATLPSRKATPKDISDAKERPDDAIEPEDYNSMDEMIKDL